jgi:uncharacterized membrane protein YkvA (DUF1232 family)
MKNHRQDYDDRSFWKKIRDAAAKVGKGGITEALALFKCLKDSDTPAAVKALIIGALGYLISPVDVVPDVILGLGYTDDIAVIAATVSAATAHMKDEHFSWAEQQWKDFFG